ncbi:MAG TPA: ring-cleaving dioxygenase [Pseudogracilibacillus sp.]|nr:ring-cleaving dioxygenase [Pseudogracilibacillus sp.]
MPTITGHHHVSMMTKSATANYHFYTKVLGLRLAKKTVNQDDPTMYHLFYGDKTGSPGTALTFFEMPNLGSTYPGTNAITRIGLLVPNEASLSYWKKRLDEFDIAHDGIEIYQERPAIHMKDPDGLPLVIMAEENQTSAYWQKWEASPVPSEHQIRGMGTIEMKVRRLDKLVTTLTELFGYEVVQESEGETVLQAVEGRTASEILLQQTEGKRERPGKGSVHHIAIRVQNEEELAYWKAEIEKRGFHSTGIIDRFYFQSLYFRESNGILFELATDGPGFEVDGVGERLALPPFLEGKRTEIEAGLVQIGEE